MKYISFENLREGEVLSQPLFGSKGEIILAKNQEIRSEFIQRLQAWGYEGVYIEEEYTKELDVDKIITPELKTSALNLLKNFFSADEEALNGQENFQDMQDMIEVMSDIVEEILYQEDVIINMIDLKVYDCYTYYHSVNVAVLAVVIGSGLGFCKEKLIQLGTAGILHDIGKKFVPHKILAKKGALLSSEYEIVKKHSEKGYETIKGNSQISGETALGILDHHERYDGSGYPNKKRGREISEFGRILAIADVYDALISKRPYHDAVIPSEALEYIMGGSGTFFDPEYVDVFVKKVVTYPVGSAVKLSNGLEGMVVQNFVRFNMRPRIKIFEEDEFYLDLKNDPETRNITITGVLES